MYHQNIELCDYFFLQRIVTKREQDSAMHAVHKQKNPEDVFPKGSPKCQCLMPILEMRNGMKSTIKKYVLDIGNAISMCWNGIF